MLDSDREILYYLFTEYLKKEKTPQKIINKITRHIHHGDVTQDLNPLLPRDGSRSMNADLTFSTDHAYNIGTDTIGIDKIHFPDVLIHSGADMLLARNSADTAYVDWWMKNVISVNGAVYTDKIRDYTCAKIEINNRVWFSGTGTFWKCQDIDCCDVTRSPIQPDLTTEANFDILNFDDGRDEGVYCLIHLRGGYKFAGVCRMHLGMFVDAVPGAGSQFVEWTIEYKKKSAIKD